MSEKIILILCDKSGYNNIFRTKIIESSYNLIFQENKPTCILTKFTDLKISIEDKSFENEVFDNITNVTPELSDTIYKSILIVESVKKEKEKVVVIIFNKLHEENLYNNKGFLLKPLKRNESDLKYIEVEPQKWVFFSVISEKVVNIIEPKVDQTDIINHKPQEMEIDKPLEIVVDEQIIEPSSKNDIILEPENVTPKEQITEPSPEIEANKEIVETIKEVIVVANEQITEPSSVIEAKQEKVATIEEVIVNNVPDQETIRKAPLELTPEMRAKLAESNRLKAQWKKVTRD